MAHSIFQTPSPNLLPFVKVLKSERLCIFDADSCLCSSGLVETRHTGWSGSSKGCAYLEVDFALVRYSK